MSCGHFFVISFALGLVLAAPAAPSVRSCQQPDPSQQADHPDQDRPQQGSGPARLRDKDQPERDPDGIERIYDRDRRDYHRWDNAEDRAYRLFWQEHHRAYREYSSLNRREQSHYWKWRHAHAELGRASADSEAE